MSFPRAEITSQKYTGLSPLRPLPNTGATPSNSTGEGSRSRNHRYDGEHTNPTSASPPEKGSAVPRSGPETRVSTRSEAPLCPSRRRQWSTTPSNNARGMLGAR